MHKKRIAPLLPVLTFAGLLTVAGCSAGGLFGSNSAHLRMVLSGDGSGANASVAADQSPALNGPGNDESHLSHWFESASVTLSSVLVRNLDGQLINVDFDLPVTVDVVKMENGKQVMLPDGVLPPGTYDQVVIVMTAVEGTTRDGTDITIEPPGGGWTAVVPICPLEVAEGSTETVSITLDVRNSFLQSGFHWGFQPRFHARASCPATEP